MSRKEHKIQRASIDFGRVASLKLTN